nr:glycosyltransferase family A protein [Phyllobacterium sp. YR620]
MDHSSAAKPALAGRRRICIGTVTRNRPQMLAQLLESYGRLERPSDTDLVFIIIENSGHATLDRIIEMFRLQVPETSVRYEIEPNLGIASARNRAIECAIDACGELLTFADDDETVEPDWLMHLLCERDKLDLDIVGSPVRPAPIDADAPFRERLVWNGLVWHSRACEAKCRRMRDTGSHHRIKLATGSWMGRVEFFRLTGLRFDTQLGLAGGEDWRLWSEARKMGALTGWTPLAVAHETIPSARLTFLYQFKRNKDHCTTEFRSKLEKRPLKTLFRLPGSLAARILSFALYCLAAPFTGGQSLVRATSCLGSITGLIAACLGCKSAHYRRTDGA